MALDVQELTAQAKQALSGNQQPAQQLQQPIEQPIEQPNYVTPEEVRNAEIEAEKSIIAAQQNAALNGGDEVINPFQEPTSLHDIVKAKLNNVTDNEYVARKLYEANLPSIEAMQRVLLTKEAREMYADAYVVGIQNQKQEFEFQSKVAETTKEGLFRKFEVVETAKEYEDQIVKQFGLTGSEVLKSMKPEEHLNRVMNFKAEQKKLFDEWRSGKTAPAASAQFDNTMYSKSAKETQDLNNLAQIFAQKYNIN